MLRQGMAAHDYQAIAEMRALRRWQSTRRGALSLEASRILRLYTRQAIGILLIIVISTP